MSKPKNLTVAPKAPKLFKALKAAGGKGDEPVQWEGGLKEDSGPDIAEKAKEAPNPLADKMLYDNNRRSNKIPEIINEKGYIDYKNDKDLQSYGMNTIDPGDIEIPKPIADYLKRIIWGHELVPWTPEEVKMFTDRALGEKPSKESKTYFDILNWNKGLTYRQMLPPGKEQGETMENNLRDVFRIITGDNEGYTDLPYSEDYIKLMLADKLTDPGLYSVETMLRNRGNSKRELGWGLYKDKQGNYSDDYNIGNLTTGKGQFEDMDYGSVTDPIRWGDDTHKMQKVATWHSHDADAPFSPADIANARLWNNANKETAKSTGTEQMPILSVLFQDLLNDSRYLDNLKGEEPQYYDNYRKGLVGTEPRGQFGYGFFAPTINEQAFRRTSFGQSSFPPEDYSHLPFTEIMQLASRGLNKDLWQKKDGFTLDDLTLEHEGMPSPSSILEEIALSQKYSPLTKGIIGKRLFQNYAPKKTTQYEKNLNGLSGSYIPPFDWDEVKDKLLKKDITTK